jgi:hypothetical protein
MNIPTNSWEFAALLLAGVISISAIVLVWLKIGRGLERRNNKQ